MRVAQVVPHSTTFIRGPAVALAGHLDSLELLVRHNPVAELAAFLPPFPAVRQARRYRWSRISSPDAWPGNVQVTRCSVPYVRRDGANPALGGRLGTAVARRLSGRRDVTLLHGHFLHPQGVAAVHAAKALGIPAVVTGHGFDVYDLPKRTPEWAALVGSVLEAADAVTVVSQRLAQEARRLGVPAGRLHVVPNGFDPRAFHPMDRGECRRRLGLPAEATLLLAVGNLVPVKGHALLLEAVAPLLQADPGLMLLIVGEGHLGAPLRRQAEALRITGQVRWVGARPHAEMPLWMNAADVFLLPSHDEGGGVVLLEALGCGTPVVSTRVGHAEQVVGQHDGYVVPPRDVQAFRQAVERALVRSFGADRIALHARKWTWEANAATTAAVYARLAASGTRHA